MSSQGPDETKIAAAAGPGGPGEQLAEMDRLRSLCASLAADKARLHRQLRDAKEQGRQCSELQAEIAQLRERLQQEEERVRAIQAMGMALGSSLELDQVLRGILDAVTQLLGADRSTLFLVDDRREYLVSRIALGQEETEFRLRMGEGVAGWVARTGRAVNLKNAYEDRRFDPTFDQATGYHTRSLLCVPV
ncbi:MAG: GAF domain-containing protein, partial [Deltaproteobacteria bacterium]|nr:GAF domain-containing protein [Deltaproteobacteria bacterium]